MSRSWYLYKANQPRQNAVTVEWKLEGGEDVSDEVQPRSCLSGLHTDLRKCVAVPMRSLITSAEGGLLRPRG